MFLLLAKRVAWPLALLVSTVTLFGLFPGPCVTMLPRTCAQGSPPLKLEHTFRLYSAEGQAPIFFSADGRLLFAMGGNNSHWRGWYLRSGRVVFDQPPHNYEDGQEDYADDFAITPDGRYLVGIRTSRKPGDEKEHVQFVVYELLTGGCAKLCDAPGEKVGQLSFDPRGKHFVTFGADDFVHLWAFPSFKEVRHLRIKPPFGRKGTVANHWVRFIRSGMKLLLVASYSYSGPKDGQEHVCNIQLLWDTDTGKVVWEQRQRFHYQMVWNQRLTSQYPNVAELPPDWQTVTADGKNLAGMIWKKVSAPVVPGKAVPEGKFRPWVRVMEAATRRTLFDLPQPELTLTRMLAFHPNGRYLLTLADGPRVIAWNLQKQRQVAAWDLSGGEEVHLGAGRKVPIPCCGALSPSGDLLAVVECGGRVCVWRIPWDKLLK
jgi:WD40 repeat protein